MSLLQQLSDELFGEKNLEWLNEYRPIIVLLTNWCERKFDKDIKSYQTQITTLQKRVTALEKKLKSGVKKQDVKIGKVFVSYYDNGTLIHGSIHIVRELLQDETGYRSLHYDGYIITEHLDINAKLRLVQKLKKKCKTVFEHSKAGKDLILHEKPLQTVHKKTSQTVKVL